MHEIVYNQMKLLLYEAEKFALMKEGFSFEEVKLIRKRFSREEIALIRKDFSENEVVLLRKDFSVEEEDVASVKYYHSEVESELMKVKGFTEKDVVLMRKGLSEDEVNFVKKGHSLEKVILMRKNLKEENIAVIRKIFSAKEQLKISHGYILFLMRRHRVKIKRLLDYLKDMDMNQLNVVKNDEGTSHVQNENATRVDQCLQFFAEIEDCNEFSSLLEDNIVDVEMKRKLERNELITKFMTETEYKEYKDLLPKATFCYQDKQDVFKEWLLEGINIHIMDQDISPLALTILEFLARETIMNILDMVFHIKTVRRKNESKNKKVFCVSSMKILNLPDTDEGGGRYKPIDAEILGEGIVTALKNVFFKNCEKLIKGESVQNETFSIDTENLSEDLKKFYIYQSQITMKEISDAYMLFQMERKPLLYFDDPFMKNPTLICLANVDDHKVP